MPVAETSLSTSIVGVATKSAPAATKAAPVTANGLVLVVMMGSLPLRPRQTAAN